MDPVRYYFEERELEDFQVSAGELINEVALSYAWDYADGQPKAALTKHNPLSKLLYGTAKGTYEMRFIQGTRLAEKIADGLLLSFSIPPITVSFRHNSSRSFYLEVGDLVAITHRAGLGDNGYEQARGIIARKISGMTPRYEVLMLPGDALYQSELLSLSEVQGRGDFGYKIEATTTGITVTVTSGSDSSPIVGAQVVLDGQIRVTSAKGIAVFGLLPKGTYVLKISAAGYKDMEVSFKV